jgi:hypothetical protein
MIIGRARAKTSAEIILLSLHTSGGGRGVALAAEPSAVADTPLSGLAAAVGAATTGGSEFTLTAGSPLVGVGVAIATGDVSAVVEGEAGATGDGDTARSEISSLNGALTVPERGGDVCAFAVKEKATDVRRNSSA